MFALFFTLEKSLFHVCWLKRVYKNIYTDIKVTGFQSRACVVSALVYVSSSLSML